MSVAQAPINPDLPPKSQTIVVGHDGAYRQIRQAFHNHAMRPVWLLSGERGIGKATLAYAMARGILETNGQEPALVARQMVQGTYPNFLALERRPNDDGKTPLEITVEESRKVSAFLNQCASIPGWRVIIIDAVDEMNRTAANALLKILEEPPVQTVFFLIAHSLGQVLPTIRSRCCHLPLSPLSDMHVSTAVGAAVSPEALGLAKGSIGRAMAIHQAGGALLLNQIIQAIAGALKGDWRSVQALGVSFGKDSPGYAVMLDLLVWTLHHIILLGHLSLDVPAREKLGGLSRLKPMTHWVDALHRIHLFLETARTSHLDRNHVIMAVFFMIENPTVGESFVYESFP